MYCRRDDANGHKETQKISNRRLLASRRDAAVGSIAMIDREESERQTLQRQHSSSSSSANVVSHLRIVYLNEDPVVLDRRYGPLHFQAAFQALAAPRQAASFPALAVQHHRGLQGQRHVPRGRVLYSNDIKEWRGRRPTPIDAKLGICLIVHVGGDQPQP